MKDNIRRLVLFTVIVGFGSLLIFVNIPLIYLLPLIMVVGFFLLILLGSITVSDIKNAFFKLSLKNLREKPILKKLDSIKFFEKKTPGKADIGKKKAKETIPAKKAEKTSGIRHHLSLLASSIKSIGKILTERKKQVKKPEEINKLLERTIAEKVSKGSALEGAAKITPSSGVRGAGGALSAAGGESDPFLSLSDEELGTDLLDGLEESASQKTLGDTSALPDVGPGLSVPELEIPALPAESADEVGAILEANPDTGSEEFESLSGGEAIDESLSDLDSINLEDVDLGDDSAVQEPAAPATVPAATSPAKGSEDLIPATPITPLAEPASPEEAEQTDMSAFAAGTAPGSDEDMLSSLAADIKQVKKEADVSLLRELKDFKAPATDIETDLKDIAEQLNALGKSDKKKILPHNAET
ncbi:MAG TPA: hypothetical protein PKM50_03315 [Methanoregula sp.]|nr:hypothetical protein [Methanoregula sp.]